MGIVAHFINAKGQNITTLLGLRRLLGAHSGVNMAEQVVKVIQDYEVTDKVGYFVLDNATNNNTCLEEVFDQLGLKVPVEHRRLRCLGHVINLTAQAFLFGVNAEAFTSEVDSDIVRANEAEELKVWRKKRPIGKLHNIVTFIRRTSQRRETFQSIVVHDKGLVQQYNQLQLVADNDTRWNSVYSMIDCSLKLRDRIDFYLYQNRDGATHGSRRKHLRDSTDPLLLRHDLLTEHDWSVLKDTHEILGMFYKLTLRTQGKNEQGERGALWEYLPVISLLMESLREKKLHYDTLSASPKDSTPESRHLLACLGNAWLKVTEYFERMQESPVYVASCVLNPKLKWRFFEARWENDFNRILQGRDSFQDLWNGTYKNQTLSFHHQSSAVLNTQSDTNLSENVFDRYITIPDSIISAIQDSYVSYCQEPCSSKFDNLLQYWQLQEAHYPDLAKMAYDMHSIPAMSAECERVFSSTKLLISDRRARLGDNIIEASECLKAWNNLEFCMYFGNLID